MSCTARPAPATHPIVFSEAHPFVKCDATPKLAGLWLTVIGAVLTFLACCFLIFGGKGKFRDNLKKYWVGLVFSLVVLGVGLGLLLGYPGYYVNAPCVENGGGGLTESKAVNYIETNGTIRGIRVQCECSENCSGANILGIGGGCKNGHPLCKKI